MTKELEDWTEITILIRKYKTTPSILEVLALRDKIDKRAKEYQEEHGRFYTVKRG